MARIIDKILTRRKEVKSERESLNALKGILESNVDQKVDISHEHYRNSHDDDGQKDAATATLIQPGWYYSFEFFPPKTEPGLENLFTRIDRMSHRLDPLFISVTWGANGSTLSRTLAVASHAQRFACVDVLLHLSCTGLTREQISQVLAMAKSSGVQNILALRGDPPQGKRSWKVGDVSGGECKRAIDLVKLIRKLHGDYFGIGVAGHPEGHPSSAKGEEGRALEIQHLKEKVDSGADFIITQFFYDVNALLEYVAMCREAGIDCPIIPGIMPIQSYSSLVKMTEFCGISVPPLIMEKLEMIRHDDEAVKRIGCEIAGELCNTILNSFSSGDREIINEDHTYSGVDGFHFYTLNLERSTIRILAALGAVNDMKHLGKREHYYNIANEKMPPVSALRNSVGVLKNDVERNLNSSRGRERGGSISETAMSTRRVLPWKPSAMENRSKEDVRPINWSNRPKSYVMRTDDWDEFPNGRWGDSTSPAFGELSDVSHFYSFTLGSDDDRRAVLGHCPLHEADVYEVFARYVEGSVPQIPWCETPLQPESFLIQPQLAKLNRYGFLTVNSQPPVNGVSSTDAAFGWGGKGGRVYQKAYFECFVSPDKANRLTRMVTTHPTMNLYAVNNAGQNLRVGVEEGGVTALTWGVFPNREILQPTIFDPDTFLVWAEEAFSLWSTMWLNLYGYGSGSYKLIEKIRDTYYLVAIIDNDFVKSSEEADFQLLKLLLDVGVESSKGHN